MNLQKKAEATKVAQAFFMECCPGSCFLHLSIPLQRFYRLILQQKIKQAGNDRSDSSIIAGLFSYFIYFQEKNSSGTLNTPPVLADVTKAV
jgi:hypothetical protein